jgi:YVTN family beta-propeller protein
MVLTVAAVVATAKEPYLSPTDLVIAPDGRSALVVNHTGRSLVSVSLPDGKVLQSRSLKRRPSGITLSANGKKAYLTVGVADGELYVVDTASLKVKKSIDLGHTPLSPRLSPDGKTLYVCNRMNNRIAVINTDRLKVTASIPVVREPIAMDITLDGKLLFVANHLPAGQANLDYVACRITVIDTKTNKVVKHIKLVNGAEGMRSIRVSPDGKYVFATHLMARFLVPTTQIERGWINTNALSALRVADQTLLFTVLLDDVDLGFANPWGVDVSDDGALLCVASAGTHELTLIDLKALTAKIDTATAKAASSLDQRHLNAHNDLSFISAIRSRVQLKGEGPRAVAIHGDTIYATEYFTDSLARVRVKDGKATDVASIPLGPELPVTQIRRGERLFNDATMCFQKWQSCASCHPDVRTDALNWDLLNDGIGNPKNVKSLLLSHKTPPVMALGVRAMAEVAVRAGIKYIQFAVRPEEDAEAIDAYLMSLEPDPSPYLVKGKLTQAAQRGKKLFETSSCISCHPAPYYTDLQKYDVGTGTGQDKGKRFDVPTLREVWRTAPYLHDGRAVTIYDVIKTHNPDDKRGFTSKLTDQQIRDLADYINTL